MKIAAISYSFPHDSRPYSGIFVRNTLAAMAELGEKIIVIAPQKRLIEKKMPYFSTYGQLEIYRPRFFSFGTRKLFGFNFYNATQYSFERAVKGVLEKTGFVPDAIYSHFLLPSGKAAIEVAKCYNSRSLCVFGESNLQIHESKYGKDRLFMFYKQFDMLITNSIATKKVLVERYNQPEAKIAVVANAVDKTRFFLKDKTESRRRLGFPIEGKIIIFTGALIQRKGPLRVLEACKRIFPKPLMIFIGSGYQVPIDPNVLYCGTVSNETLVDYLNAADVFVLPTLNEGMSNAVLEAMACGLPVVTSPIESNVELLGVKYPFFCNPLDVDDIARHIELASRSGVQSYDNIMTTQDRATKILSKLTGKSI